MIDLIKIGTYTPLNITEYEIKFDDIVGTDEQTEAGTDIREVIRQEAPRITFVCTMLTQAQAVALMAAVKPASFSVTYWSDTQRTCDMKCVDRSMQMAGAMTDGTRYFNVSIKLEHC